jgi:hypothetical protein
VGALRRCLRGFRVFDMRFVVAGPGRNVYIDFFRSLALLCIFVDHSPGDWLDKVTFGHLGACDALGVFILLAGCSAGYAYGAVLFRRGWAPAARKVLRRVGVIYAASLVLVLALWVSATILDRSATGRGVLNSLQLERLPHISSANLLAVLTFNYPMGLAEILRDYLLLFLALAAALPLLRFPRILLSLSVALYIASLFGLTFSRLPIGVGAPDPEINLLAWQVVLVIGAVTVSAPSLRPRPRAIWDGAAAAMILAAFAMRLSVVLADHGHHLWILHAPFLAFILTSMKAAAAYQSGKLPLHPLRLANLLACAWLAYRLAPFYGRWISQTWAKPFILCGQHSLPVFCIGAFLAPWGGMWLAHWKGPASEASYNIAGIVMMVFMAALASAWRSWGWPSTTSRAAPVEPMTPPDLVAQEMHCSPAPVRTAGDGATPT